MAWSFDVKVDAKFTTIHTDRRNVAEMPTFIWWCRELSFFSKQAQKIRCTTKRRRDCPIFDKLAIEVESDDALMPAAVYTAAVYTAAECCV